MIAFMKFPRLHQDDVDQLISFDDVIHGFCLYTSFRIPPCSGDEVVKDPYPRPAVLLISKPVYCWYTNNRNGLRAHSKRCPLC